MTFQQLTFVPCRYNFSHHIIIYLFWLFLFLFYKLSMYIKTGFNTVLFSCFIHLPYFLNKKEEYIMLIY